MNPDFTNIKNDKIIHSKNTKKSYIFIYIFSVTFFILLFPFFSKFKRISSYEFIATIETIGSLFSIIAGLALISRFSWSSTRWHLFVGLAFFSNGAFEMLHGSFLFISLLHQTQIQANIIVKIIDATEITASLFLVSLLILAFLVRFKLNKSKAAIKEIFLFTVVTIIFAILIIILSFQINYKVPINYQNIISHPINFVIAILLIFSSLPFILEYIKNSEILNWWIALSISIIIISNFYISFSKHQFDTLFEFALILKVIGYLIIFTGVSIYMFIRIQQMNKAETILIEQKYNLEEQVNKQTYKLKKSEKKHRELFENSIIGMYKTTETGEILMANTALCKMLGYSSFEELKSNKANVSNHINKKSHEKFRKKINNDGFVNGFETKWITKDKKEIYIRENSIKKTLKNNKIIYEGTVEDITKQVLAEKQKEETTKELQEIIEYVNVPVFGLNKNYKINIWNEEIENITGYKKNEVLNKSLTENPLQNIFESKIIGFTKSAFDLSRIFDFEINLKSKKGEQLKFLLNITPHQDSNSNSNSIIYVARNLTQLDKYKNELEKKVKERTLELEKALFKEIELGKLKSRFVTMASHEFRTPLTAINFAAGFVKKYWNKLDEQKRNEKLLKIEEQVEHMIFMLDDVLTIGKAEAGKTKIKPTIFNTKKFLDEIIEEVHTLNINQHKINYNNINTDCLIYIDKNVGRNIFINLITNAIKFSPNADTVNINFSCENNFTTISIIDFGIGIPDNEIDEIFTPFYRTESVETIQGTGLGLAIVKELVEKHNGTVKVKSKINKGTTFTVSLPLPIQNKLKVES